MTPRDGLDPDLIRKAASLDADHGQEATVPPEARRNLPMEFWASDDILAMIHQAAQARYVSPDAVLGCVLARVAAFTPPCYKIPPIVGTACSLSFYAAIIGGPSTGKSAAKAVACELVPSPGDWLRDDLPLGSGEGLMDSYFTVSSSTKDGARVQSASGVFAYLDEGQSLTELGTRKGSTLLPTLRTMWKGETAGQTNANSLTRRVLPHGTYALGLAVGFQPASVEGLLNDAPGGTPQRFCYFSATDPNLPDRPPEFIDSLGWKPLPAVDLACSTIELADAIVAEVQLERLEVSRGHRLVADLDAHRTLLRLKVAALFAVLHGRRAVSAEDWAVADAIVGNSARVRDFARGEINLAKRIREQAQTATAIRKNRAVDADAVEAATRRVAKTMATRARKLGGSVTPRVLWIAAASRDRALTTQVAAFDFATEQGWLKQDGEEFIAGEVLPW